MLPDVVHTFSVSASITPAAVLVDVTLVVIINDVTEFGQGIKDVLFVQPERNSFFFEPCLAFRDDMRPHPVFGCC